MRRQHGFTLIEIVIALAVLGILIAAVVVTVLDKVADAKIQRAIDETRTIEGGVATWVQRTGTTTFTGLSMTALTTAGAVPSALAAANANPWAGAYSVSGDTNTFTITVANLPNARACNAFSGAFGRRATVTCPGTYPGTVSIAFANP